MIRTCLSFALGSALCGVPLGAQAPPPTAAEIMIRVAANYDRAEAERTRYRYLQHARVASLKGKRLLCEEVTDSRVLPQASSSGQEYIHFRGQFWQHKRYIPYGEPLSKLHESLKHEDPKHEDPKQETPKVNDAAPGSAQRDVSKHDDPSHPEANDGTLKDGTITAVVEGGDASLDIELVESLRRSLMERDSKDGFAAGLSPLSGKAQSSYDYRLVGREHMNGHDTFHLSFQPKATSDYNWAGDAWIDTEVFEPVLVRTRLARSMPFLVKSMLGTNIPGLGFAVTYAPQPDGVWFPATFGTEFKIRVLFLFTRQITMSAVNSQFERTHVASRIVPGP